MSAWLPMLEQFAFLRPGWLLALPVLLVVAWWLHRQRRQTQLWRQSVDAHLLPHLLDGHTGSAGRWPIWFGMGALFLALLALAGPSLHTTQRPLWQARAPLVVALDLSGSMLATDLPPSRLVQARAKLEQLLHERRGGQVALVVFADDAFTVAPLTEDAANVAVFLDALAPDVMPTDGHRVDRALVWSMQLLQQAGYSSGQILLMTDRADARGMAQAAKARTAGYRVSVLGVGRTSVPAALGGAGAEAAPFNPSELKQLAATGGGQYAVIGAGDADLRALDVLNPQTTEGRAGKHGVATLAQDDGYWLLPLVLLLCLPLFRRGAGFAVVLLAALWLPLAPAPALAQAVHAQAVRAQKVDASTAAPSGTWWQRADQRAYARMQEGIAAYKSKDYARAIERLSAIHDAEGQYNLGNALARAGRYDDAIAAYDRALQQQPNMQDAIFNRRLVKLARKLPKRQQNQGNQQQPNQQKNQQGSQSSQPSKPQHKQQPNPQKSQQPNQHSTPQSKPQPKQATQPSQAPPSQPPTTADAKAQRQADAAQRARMDQAVRQAAKSRNQPPQKQGQQKAAETPAQRERRLANQAWLQRIPDDPGALLRARFQIEAARRRGEQP